MLSFTVMVSCVDNDGDNNDEGSSEGGDNGGNSGDSEGTDEGGSGLPSGGHFDDEGWTRP